MDIPTLLATEGVPILRAGEHHHVRSGWIGLDCPFCSPNQSRFRLGYPIGGRVFVCWSCGRHGMREVLEAVIPRNRIDWNSLKFPVPKIDGTKKLNGTVVLPKGLECLTQPHIDYIQKRGFDPYLLDRFWGVKGIGKFSRNPWRLFLPIHFNGEIVSFATRSLCKEGQRYICAKPSEEKYHHKDLLFGEDFVPSGTIIIVEGFFDVYRIGAGAVSCFGTTYTKSQVLRASKYAKRYVCFDNHPDAQKQARNLCEELSCFPGETNNLVLDSKDPGEADEREIKQLRELLTDG